MAYRWPAPLRHAGPVTCRVCGSELHQRACPVRLAPGWLVPPRVELPGSPHEPDPPPLPVWRAASLPPPPGPRRLGQIPVHDRPQLAQAAAAARREGRTWGQIGQALNVSLTTARRLALSAAGTA